MMLIRLLFAIAILYISGFVILYSAMRRDWGAFGPLATAGVCLLLGLGAVTLQMFLYSMMGLGYGPALVSFPWLVFGATTAVRAWKMRPASPGTGPLLSLDGAGALGVFLLVIILSQVVYAFIHALTVPMMEWDAVRTWFFKSTAFFIDGRVSATVFKWDDLVHPDYPLLVSLSGTWVYEAMGGIFDQAVRVLYPLQFISLLAIFHFVVKRSSNSLCALLFTAMLSVTPVLMVHAGGVEAKVGGLHSGDYVGCADLPLAAYMLASASALYLYAKERSTGFLILAALFLGFGAWTKNEGQTFLIIGGLVGCYLALAEGRGARPFIAFVVIAIALALPWQIYKLNLNITAHEDARISVAYAIKGISRLPRIFAFFKLIMFEKTPLFNFTWYLYVLGALLNWRGFFRRPLVYLNILLFGQFAAYVFAYMVTVLDLNFHLATSCERLVLQLVPLAMLITALNFKEFLSIGEKPAP